MRRLIVLCCLVAGAMLVSPHAEGGELAHKAWHKFWAGYYRNKHWPEPFQTLDRQAVMAPIEQMKNNGWRLHNTLGDQLFVAETNELTSAAEIKVHWIGTQAPVTRRTVFVYGAEHDPVTQARVSAVQAHITQLFPQGGGPSVLVTPVLPRGASGEIFDRVMTGYRDSITAPALPGGGGAGGGGSTP